MGSARIVLVGAALVLAAAAAGYLAIPFVDGGKYPQAPTLFVVLSIGLVPGLALAPMTAALLRAGRNADLLRSQVAAIAACAATVLLLRSHGPYAVAWSTPAAVAAQFAWLSIVTLRARRPGDDSRVSSRAPSAS